MSLQRRLGKRTCGRPKEGCVKPHRKNVVGANFIVLLLTALPGGILGLLENFCPRTATYIYIPLKSIMSLGLWLICDRRVIAALNGRPSEATADLTE